LTNEWLVLKLAYTRGRRLDHAEERGQHIHQ